MKVFKEEIEVLRLKGKDVSDFLHRVSTNDIKKFDDNSVLRTVFTTDKGRIVDFVTALNINGEYILICSSGRERIVTDFLNKYLVSEDFEVAFDRSKKYTIIPESEKDYEYLSGCNYVEGNFFYLDEYAFRKLVLVVLNENSDYVTTILKNSEFISYDEFKSFAIEKMYLFDSNELNDDINPLECGLRDYISFNKGCYIGQEVIARLVAQGKIPKVMVKIVADFEMNAGDKIYFKDSETETECGFISSAGKRNNIFIALGFIKGRDLNENFKYYINKEFNNTVLINK